MEQKKILVAEDNSFQAQVIRTFLEDAGHKVEVQINGIEAVNSIEREQPDLLVLDILMPEENGYDVLEHYREKEYSFPVVVLSNLEGAEEEGKCRQYGIVDFITKSDVDVEDIPVKIQKYL